MKRVLCILAVTVLAVSIVVAGDLLGDITQTYNEVNGPTKRIDLDWVSGTNGVVDVATTNVVNGRLERVVFKPDSGGTQPDANYDVELHDLDGFDVLAGFGTNLSQTVSTSVAPGQSLDDNNGSTNPVPYSVESKLTLKVFNAGSANGGIVRLYVRP